MISKQQLIIVVSCSIMSYMYSMDKSTDMHKSSMQAYQEFIAASSQKTCNEKDEISFHMLYQLAQIIQEKSTSPLQKKVKESLQKKYPDLFQALT
jgi:hypothetical protein